MNFRPESLLSGYFIIVRLMPQPHSSIRPGKLLLGATLNICQLYMYVNDKSRTGDYFPIMLVDF